MSAFAGSQLSADDAVAFHSQYHDTMHGTFAVDKHHNLPRPLRSYLPHRNRDISVLSSTPTPPPPATSSSSSVFCTPQWNEFSDCVREVSPLDGEEDRTDKEGERSEGSSATDARERKGTRGERAPFTSSTDRSVVDRLAELSQNPDVDPVAVAAVLREAENMLTHPTNNAAGSTPAQRRHAQANQHRTHLRSHGNGDPLDRDGQRPSQQTGRRAHDDESDEAARHERRHHHHRRRDTQRDRQAFMYPAGAAHQPWPWPSNMPVSEETAVRDPPSPAWHQMPPTPFVCNPFPSAVPPAVDKESTRSTPVPWYEVYYAWMLYYQQLYATQILQYERQQRRMQRREAQRGRSERRPHRTAPEPNLWAEQDDAPDAGQERQQERALPGRAVEGDRALPATIDDAGPPNSHHHHPANVTPRQRQQTSRPPKRLSESVTAANRKYGEAHDAQGREAPLNGTEAQLLRAQVQHLEEQLAALSALVTVDDPQRRGPGKTFSKEAPNSAKTDNEGNGARLRSSGTRRSPERIQPHSAAAQLAETQPATATAATWRELAERQRSRSGDNRDRSRLASPQRPQWR
ncbi:hypothetical protein ABB37_03431 [Leptomonas pyrrhocoris]|uniref:Uncharacterized protein n=1 Tax=Leptomonas pyrrhocoris TaxID=157538 RepID=A0A0N0DX31_LEPPY|nr:hypothetical protein ABB37_03431 [Leptomonas pyrrhocoris]KPA82342.1 hypothetical protein ABB37_03431 [Leptomonas pyrrhocoris]|eukprot:XP_015660781.1 hypothetical protein ABB37_03431 [Leptomonas pyrrhocoris]